MLYSDRDVAQAEFKAAVNAATPATMTPANAFIQLISNGSRYAANVLDVESIDLGEVF
jgi:hypothetical protein